MSSRGAPSSKSELRLLPGVQALIETLRKGRLAVDLNELGDLFVRAAEEIDAHRAASQDGDSARLRRQGYDVLVGQSESMQELYRLLDKIRSSDATVLIQGENGTGKELVARAIHDNSSRKDRRFVAQNCSALNDNLLDSELFGHKRGSFTGAVFDKQGLFEAADRGTFFLDEIGDMSPALQVKLLRVLQEGTLVLVGSTETKKVDVRVIAATNRDLGALATRGEFREDLYYRVNVISVVVPPLRERKDDIRLLVDHFLRKKARTPKQRSKRLSKSCLERMMAYDWPGNVRELENEIERLIVFSGDARIIEADLLSRPIAQAAARSRAAGSSLPEAVSALERRMISDVLRRNGGNKSQAARELAISRRNLIRKVRSYKLGRG